MHVAGSGTRQSPGPCEFHRQDDGRASRRARCKKDRDAPQYQSPDQRRLALRDAGKTREYGAVSPDGEPAPIRSSKRLGISMTVEAIDPGDTDSLSVDIVEAKQRLAKGDEEGALALLAQLIADDASNVPARFLLGLTAWKMGRLDWALALVRECHEARPMDGGIAEVLASLYAQAGDLQESLFIGKLATALKFKGVFTQMVPAGFPSFDWAFQNIKANPKLAAAELNLANGKMEQAVEEARQHAALNSEDDAAQTFYANLLLRTGVASKAVEVLRRTEQEDDFTPSQASLFARALTAVGDLDAARRWHDEAIALAPENAEIVAARVADGLWLETDRQRLETISNAWARRFAPPAK